MLHINTTRTKLENIKKQAKHLKNSSNHSHSECLDIVSKQNGYDDFHHLKICFDKTEFISDLLNKALDTSHYEDMQEELYKQVPGPVVTINRLAPLKYVSSFLMNDDIELINKETKVISVKSDQGNIVGYPLIVEEKSNKKSVLDFLNLPQREKLNKISAAYNQNDFEFIKSFQIDLCRLLLTRPGKEIDRHLEIADEILNRSKLLVKLTLLKFQNFNRIMSIDLISDDILRLMICRSLCLKKHQRFSELKTSMVEMEEHWNGQELDISYYDKFFSSGYLIVDTAEFLSSEKKFLNELGD